MQNTPPSSTVSSARQWRVEHRPSVPDVGWRRRSARASTGRLVTLRELGAADGAHCSPSRDRPEVARFLSPPPQSLERFTGFIESTLQRAPRGPVRRLRDRAARHDHAGRSGADSPDRAGLPHRGVGHRARLRVVGPRALPGRRRSCCSSLRSNAGRAAPRGAGGGAQRARATAPWKSSARVAEGLLRSRCRWRTARGSIRCSGRGWATSGGAHASRGGGAAMGPLTMRRVVAVCAAFALLALHLVAGVCRGPAPATGSRASPRAWARPARRASSCAVRAAPIWPAAFAPPARGSARSCRPWTPSWPTSPTIGSKRSPLDPRVAGVHLDRPVAAMLSDRRQRRRATATCAAAQGQFDGSGVGVAIIDSGVTPWHDDLAQKVNNGRGPERPARDGLRRLRGRRLEPARRVRPRHARRRHHRRQRVGRRWQRTRASRPARDLLVLQRARRQGRGTVSDVIRALDFAVANRARFHLRVINLSIGAAVLESYETDPLTLAAQHAVEAGLVVVAAAGNFGKNADGKSQYGGITAPGNSPWVLTVGAYSTIRHAGSVRRSRRRLQLARSDGRRLHAKPDLVAPGTRIVSLNDDGSYLSNALSRGTGRRHARRRAVPVLHAQRHQHGGARGDRRRRAHAAGRIPASRRTPSRRSSSTRRPSTPTRTSSRRARAS